MTIVVSFPLAARLTRLRPSSRKNSPFVIDNKPGANGYDRRDVREAGVARWLHRPRHNARTVGNRAPSHTPPTPARLIVLYHSNELNRQRTKVAESNVERRREWQLEHAGVRARRNDLTRLQTFVARREKIREPY